MFLVVANFKSHQTEAEVKSWLDNFSGFKAPSGIEVAVAPAFPHLSLLPARATFSAAAQDVSPFPPGSYTGAVNARQLKELGVKYCLVGHSERRRYFHETSADVANKAALLLDQGITPLICMDQPDIVPQFAALDADALSRSLFCFEPAGDIGTGVADSSEDIRATVALIKKYVSARPVLYGGSVNSGNIGDLSKLDLGGVLVASASLDPASFKAVIGGLNHGTNQ